MDRVVIGFDTESWSFDSMRPTAGILKVLTVLLMLRMIAAPVAVRPALATTNAHLNVIVRVCAWPAERAGRSSSTIVLRFCRGYPARYHGCGGRSRARHGMADSPHQERIGILDLARRRLRSTVHIPDSPRC